MFKNKSSSLTAAEKKIAKGLLARKWRNQDIQALVNLGRPTTVNSGRITGVKQDVSQKTASDAEIDRYLRVKDSFDPKTGLNPYTHERLVRAREAMLMAVGVFNSPTLAFKTELFCVLSNIAWTYLFHEYYSQKVKNVEIVKPNGQTLALSELLGRQDCPISEAAKLNLLDVKKLRDKVEHSLLEKSDQLWGSLFQANCLNFDRILCELFGDRLTLQNDLAFSLQFSKANLEQLKELSKHDVPPSMAALNKEMSADKTPDQLNNLEYQFSVVYSMVASSKAKANVQFLHTGPNQTVEVTNVVVKKEAGDTLYPFKPKVVAKMVEKSIGKTFGVTAHTLAWKKRKVRPPTGIVQPNSVNATYCMYHQAHNDYTYNQAWVDHLIAANS